MTEEPVPVAIEVNGARIAYYYESISYPYTFLVKDQKNNIMPNKNVSAVIDPAVAGVSFENGKLSIDKDNVTDGDITLKLTDGIITSEFIIKLIKINLLISEDSEIIIPVSGNITKNYG